MLDRSTAIEPLLGSVDDQRLPLGAGEVVALDQLPAQSVFTFLQRFELRPCIREQIGRMSILTGVQASVGERRAHGTPPVVSGSLGFSVCFCLRALQPSPWPAYIRRERRPVRLGGAVFVPRFVRDVVPVTVLVQERGDAGRGDGVFRRCHAPAAGGGDYAP